MLNRLTICLLMAAVIGSGCINLNAGYRRSLTQDAAVTSTSGRDAARAAETDAQADRLSPEKDHGSLAKSDEVVDAQPNAGRATGAAVNVNLQENPADPETDAKQAAPAAAAADITEDADADGRDGEVSAFGIPAETDPLDRTRQDQIDINQRYQPGQSLPARSLPDESPAPEPGAEGAEPGNVEPRRPEKTVTELRQELEQVSSELSLAEEQAIESSPELTELRQRRDRANADITAFLDRHPEIAQHRQQEAQLLEQLQAADRGLHALGPQHPERRALAETRRMAIIAYSAHRDRLDEVEDRIANVEPEFAEMRYEAMRLKDALKRRLDGIESVKNLRARKHRLENQTMRRIKAVADQSAASSSS